MSNIDRLDNAIKELQEIRDLLKQQVQGRVPDHIPDFDQSYDPKYGPIKFGSLVTNMERTKLFKLVPNETSDTCGPCALNESGKCAHCTWEPYSIWKEVSV